MPLKLLPFGEKSSLVRQHREIVSKKPNLPKIVCPLSGVIPKSKLPTFTTEQVSKLLYAKIVGSSEDVVRVATTDDDFARFLFGEEGAEGEDPDVDSDERCLCVEGELAKEGVESKTVSVWREDMGLMRRSG